MILNIKAYSFNLPWFIYDLANLQLITSPTIPESVKDTKNVVFAETQVPGLNYRPVAYGGAENRKISFSLPIILRNNTVGNVLLLKQFDQLRNQSSLTSVTTGQFRTNPKVLYYWGTGSLPLVYYVAGVEFDHRGGMVNAAGNPQYTTVSINLILDEANPLTRMEEVYRKLSAIAGTVIGTYQTAAYQANGRGARPY